LSPSYGEREVAYQLDDAQAVAVVVQGDLAPLVHAVRREAPRLKHVITVGPGARAEREGLRFADLVEHAPTTPLPPPGLAWDDLLVLPYSSGTTRLPKGVLLSHKAFVCNHLQIILETPTTAQHAYLVFL